MEEIKNTEFYMYEIYGGLYGRPVIRMFLGIPLSEENLKLKSLISKLQAEDIGLVKEIVKLEKEIKAMKE